MKSVGMPSAKFALRVDLIGVALTVVLTAGAYFIQVEPLIGQRETQRATVAELGTEQHKLPDLKRTMQSVRMRLDTVKQAIAETDLKLQPASELNERLARLTQVATDNKLQIDEVEPGKVMPGQQFETITIRLSGRGGYQDSTSFLRDLHRAMPDTSVTSMDLAAGGGVGKSDAGFSFILHWHTAPTDEAKPNK